MTLTELKKAIEQVKTRENMKDILYENYIQMKRLSNKQAKLVELLNLGINYYNTEQFDFAYSTFTKAIDFEADADAFHNRGTTCMDLNNLIQAIHDFTAAIIFCPTYASPYLNRGLCILQLLSDNGALNNYEYEDIKMFAKFDFQKAYQLGLQEANQYIKIVS